MKKKRTRISANGSANASKGKGQSSLEKLKSVLKGTFIGPEDAEYEAARGVFYKWIDRRPAGIVRVADASDIARVVSHARDYGLHLAVRSGGHSAAGHSMIEGGIVIDLAAMRRIEIDASKRTAWAETGLTAGQYTVATGAHGLATGFGDSGTVGIGGLTLGGGVGFLVRKHGMTIDDLLAADIVTGDGSVLRVDAESHPDLFWAIRGGGGNFGVAARFKFRLHPVDQVVGGVLMLPATAEIIRRFIREAETAPEELSVIANVMRAPPMPMIPQEHHGKLMIMAMMIYAGDVETGQRVVAPLRQLAQPVGDMIKPMKYPEIYAMEGPHPAAVASRSMFIDKVDEEISESIVHHIGISKASMAVTQLRVLGGAMARVPADATAFAHRNRRIMVNVAALYEDRSEADEHEAWASGITDALRRDPAVYVNFLGDEGEARVRDAYPSSTWNRLTKIKATYDPGNLFRCNQNIPPAR